MNRVSGNLNIRSDGLVADSRRESFNSTSTPKVPRPSYIPPVKMHRWRQLTWEERVIYPGATHKCRDCGSTIPLGPAHWPCQGAAR